MLIIKSRKKRSLGLNEPLRHESHKKPVTRRDFLAQGFTTGAATVVAPAVLGALLGAKKAQAALGPDLRFLADPANDICNIQQGAGKIPFICFDLAGGANIAGSNVLVGKDGGQLDFLSTQGYSKLGLPGTMLPNNATTDFINEEFGLMFHSDSAFLRGMLEKTTATTRAGVNGCVIAARSENDTGNNPHNPMYGIAKAGARGELLTLIGSQNSDSGGNSMAPAMLMDPANRPTKIDRASDASGLVDTGALGTLFTKPDGSPDTASTVAVMEQMARISEQKLLKVDPGADVANPAKLETQVKCGYVRTADTVARFSSPAAINPAVDPDIIGTGGIFGPNFGNDGEFQKTSAVMKLVVEGYAGAGTISMGGFDYHTGDRSTGELRDLRAGRCIGACLEFAARRGKPLMIYVFSDGSLASNGMVDNSVDGRGKGQWTGDNQSTAASFFLVYNPPTAGGRPVLLTSGAGAARHQQIGTYTAGGDVVNSSSPAANNVNLLVQTVLLNYMALHKETGLFNAKFGAALGAGTALDGLIAFNPICTGKIGVPA
ncbi:MAG TPA: hypothetical protein VN705_25005 [Steroidobacteraceae bacterium]|nr:hypothetical protein [Steroidobacteraceae bacterium]